MPVGDCGDGADVHETEGRVAGAFDPDQFGLVGADQVRDVGLDAWGKGHLDSVCFGDLCEVAVGAPVYVGDADDMAACCEGLQDYGGGCGARGEGEGVFCVFEGGDGGFEVIAVGVRGPGVFVEPDWLADGSLGKGCAEGDGLYDSAGDGVMRAACMDGESAELVDWRRGTGWSRDAGLDRERRGRHFWVGGKGGDVVQVRSVGRICDGFFVKRGQRVKGIDKEM